MKYPFFIFIWTLLISVIRAEDRLDLAYGTSAGEELKLDLSVPAWQGPFPVCILVHGMSSWRQLNSDYIAQLVNWLNKTLKA
ncbi:hypothetical protein IMCC26134_05145 [Verrucomicrobia bacterium IMCC26134]|nr:hypothetical protein IMCC26134_05145 [Verrucomicrobia bacterium IMCC26134]